MFYHAIILTGTDNPAGIKPLGAYRIAHTLRESGYNILVVDSFNKLEKDVLFDIFKNNISEHTLFVGYSSSLFVSKIKKSSDFLPFSVDDFKELNVNLKKLNPNLKIIFGGAYSKSLQSWNIHNLDNLGVDYVMHGYSETMILNFVHSLENKEVLNISDTYNGLSVISYDSTALGFNFRDTPHLWHKDDCIIEGEPLPIEIARGCIFKCKFCAYPLLGKNPNDNSYLKSEEALTTEIRYNYENFKTLTYVITDDTFNERIDKIETLLRVRDKLKLDLSFVGYNRLDLIARKPEQLKLLKDLNFIGHFFGIESLNYESAKSIGKGLKPQEIKDTLYKVRDTFGGKVSISAGFIAGLPHETRETLDTWVSWLKEENNPIDYVSLVPLGIIQTTHTSSSFFSNPEKYGYTLINGSWRNKEWSREEVSAIVKKYQDEFENLNRQKIFCFFLPRLLFYGFSIEQILNWTLRDIPKSVSLNMLEEKNNYSNKLLNLNR